MIKRTIWATLAVFMTWSILDYLIHQILLKSTYQATSHLWRPEQEMNMVLMTSITLVLSLCFVAIYSYLVNPKSLSNGIKYGMILGFALGLSMGFGSYSYMPIPFSLAVSWFVASFVEFILAGALIGLIVKSEG